VAVKMKKLRRRIRMLMLMMMMLTAKDGADDGDVYDNVNSILSTKYV
jgi:hypothetical protein